MKKITLNLQPSNSSTCKCTQDDDSQTTKTIVKLPQKTTSWRTKIQVNGINKKLKLQFKLK